MKSYYQNEIMILGVKQLTLLLSLLLGSLYAHAQAPDFAWASQSTGGHNPNCSEYGHDIAFDSQGNKYVVGNFEGSITFGSITLTGSSYDTFIAKFDPSGNVVWAKETGGVQAGSAYGNSIAVDGNSNSYITGNFQGSVTLGSTTLTSSGSNDIFIAKYDGSGNVLWAKQAGGTSTDRTNDIAIDGSGNSYITGYFIGSATFGSTTLNSNGSYDIFIVKYDASGNMVWVKKAGGTGFDKAESIAVDGDGTSYITGTFSGSATFGSSTLTSTSDDDVFIVKCNASGNVQWAKQAGGTGYVTTKSIAVDAQGYSYITGDFYRNATFGSTTLNNSSSYNVFIVKYDDSGTVVWAKQAGGNEDEESHSIAVDGSANIYITGNFRGNASFGSTSLTSSSYRDVFIAKFNAAGTVVWAKKAGGTVDVSNYGYSIAVDGIGYSYITGSFKGSAAFSGTTLTSSGDEDVFVVKYDPSGNVVWATNPVGFIVNNISRDVVVDAAGNSYITGSFQGRATFGNSTLTSSGSSDVFLAKYDPSGTVLWVKQSTGTEIAEAQSIAVDVYGNSYITGYFKGSVIFGSTTLTSDPCTNIFLAKYDASGNLQWARQTAGTGNDRDNGIAVDVYGHIYVTGEFYNSTTFGSTRLDTRSNDVFVAKYDGSGNLLWVKQAGGTSEDIAYSIAVDGSGNSYITGSFRGSATFGSIKLTGSGTKDASGVPATDIFIAKFNSSGTVQWAKRAGGTGNDKGNSIAVDGSGNSYITGDFTGSATFGSTTLTGSGTKDVFIAKYDGSSGNVLWVKKGGAAQVSGLEVNTSIATDGSGKSYLTGTFQGSAIFGSTTLTSNGLWDVYIVKYDPSGIVQWAKSAGGTGNEVGKSIGIDGGGNSYITGSFQRSTTFGSTILTTTGTEAYLAKINAESSARYALPTAGSGSYGNVDQVHNLNAYPNPFTDKLMLELTTDVAAQSAIITLNTIEGKTVYQKEVKLTNGRVSEELNGLSSLPAGMYFLRLQVAEKPIVLKVMKQY